LKDVLYLIKLAWDEVLPETFNSLWALIKGVHHEQQEVIPLQNFASTVDVTGCCRQMINTPASYFGSLGFKS
jgi:hypothetical protein